MFIRKVKVEGFRSYKTLETDEFEFSPHQNLIIGLNGHGKSNILNGTFDNLTFSYFIRIQ